MAVRFPLAERFLPTERLLCQCSPGTYTVLRSGRKTSNSLVIWAWRLCFEKNHRDWNAVTSFERPPTTVYGNIANVDAGPFNTTVKLPKMAFTTVTPIRTITSRDYPQNRTFFIIGHCFFVILLALLALMAQTQSFGRKHPPETA